MLKYMLYRNGKILKGSGMKYHVPSGKDFIWIFLEKPDKNEISKAAKDFGINERFFQSYVKEQRSVRYSINPLILVFIDYYLESGEIKSSRILFVLKKNCLLIVLPERATYHSGIFDRVAGSFEKRERKNIAFLMYEFLAEDVNENYDVLEKVDSIIADMEKRTMKAGIRDTRHIGDIIDFKRRIFKMSRRFWASAKIIFVLRKGLAPVKLDEECTLLMDDVYNTYMHQIDILSSERETLSDILTIHTANVSNALALISNELSQVMKKLTSLTVIVMVPSLMAAIYGMNFANMPELRLNYGYFAVLAAMALAALLLYRFFHSRDWV